MKKLEQGRLEVFTTKADAIDRFMQLQGTCREKMCDDHTVEFYCWGNGKIMIANIGSRRRRAETESSTQLFAQVVQQDGKTYVTYYTRFDKTNNVLKVIFLILDVLLVIVGLVVAVQTNAASSLVMLLLALAMLGFLLFQGGKEEDNAPQDSAMLVNQLRQKVEAVNLWDK